MKRLKGILLKNGLLVISAVLYVFIMKIIGITCPILALFNIPCPTCGMSRALICLIRLDLKGYMSYNPMALPLCAAVLIMFNLGEFKKKRTALVISLGIVVLNFIFYLIK